MIVYPVGFVVLVVTKMFTNITTQKTTRKTPILPPLLSLWFLRHGKCTIHRGDHRDSKEGSIVVSLVVFVVMEITVIAT